MVSIRDGTDKKNEKTFKIQVAEDRPIPEHKEN